MILTKMRMSSLLSQVPLKVSSQYCLMEFFLVSIRDKFLIYNFSLLNSVVLTYPSHFLIRGIAITIILAVSALSA